MAYVGRDFSTADVGENEVYSFDFAKDLIGGETILSAEWECSNDAILLPVGLAAHTGSIVSQRLHALKAGTATLGCFVETSLNNRRHLYASVVVQAP